MYQAVQVHWIIKVKRIVPDLTCSLESFTEMPLIALVEYFKLLNAAIFVMVSIDKFLEFSKKYAPETW